jgi:hypothetical protein
VTIEEGAIDITMYSYKYIERLQRYLGITALRNIHVDMTLQRRSTDS